MQGKEYCLNDLFWFFFSLAPDSITATVLPSQSQCRNFYDALQAYEFTINFFKKRKELSKRLTNQTLKIEFETKQFGMEPNFSQALY